MNCYEEALAINEELINWRRDLHKIPELGIELPKTVEYISKKLTEMGIDHEVHSDVSCIFVTIGKGDPCILLRSDMDGLPIEEPKCNVDFPSTNGCMHACGHDIHAATMLGVAKILKAHESELKGTVKLLFQSGEETFQGASAAIEKGILENPKPQAAFAIHAFAPYPIGEIQYGKIPMGAVYGFKITLTGKGGHGSQPEICIDPINAGVQVYLALQSLLARELPPTQEAALTIGQFNAGQAANAIPETAVLAGTLRTFNPEIRAMLIERINAISKDVAAAYRCKCDIEVLSSVPSIICDEEFSKLCLNSVDKISAVTNVRHDLHLIGSEDFAVIADKVPGCLLVSGAGVEDPERRRGQHNPDIVFNEDVLSKNVSIYLQVALDFLNS